MWFRACLRQWSTSCRYVLLWLIICALATCQHQQNLSDVSGISSGTFSNTDPLNLLIHCPQRHEVTVGQGSSEKCLHTFSCLILYG